MPKLTLSDITNPTNDNSIVAAFNANNALIEAAFDNTVSRDGSTPNSMASNLDMNSNRIINLPAPLTNTEPLRLQDANTLNGGGTIQSIPAGGVAKAKLTKNSATDYDVSWTRTTEVVDSTFTIEDNSDATKKLAFECSGITTGNTRTLTPPNSSDTIVGLAASQTLTNKTLTTPVINTPDINAGTADSLTSLSVRNTAAANDLLIVNTDATQASNRTMTVNLQNGNRTLKFPTTGAGTAELVTLDATQTLTNKTLTSPVLTGVTLTNVSSFSLDNTATAFELFLASTDAAMAANRTITFNTNNGNRAITLSGDVNTGGGFTTSGASALTLTTTGTTNSTLPAGTLTLASLTGTEVFTNKTATLTAGTTGVAPLTYTSGSLLTSAVAGATEYLTNVFYSTPNTSNRGVSPSQHFLSLSANQTGTDTATAQVWFPGGGATGITLPASTSYFFEGNLAFLRSAGTTSHTISLLFAGTATLSSIMYHVLARAADSSSFQPSSGALAGIQEAASAVILSSASTNANEIFAARVQGIVRINGAGTFIPQFQYSAAPGGAPSVRANTYFRMHPIGTNTALNVGNWS